MANILLVDDDKDVLILAQKVLESQGHNILITQDALSAIDLLEHHYVDVIISDANMPLYSGFDLIKTLRKDERFQRISMIMLTGRRSREDIEMAIKLRIDDYIVKPADPMTFISKVEAVLAKRTEEKRRSYSVPPTSTHASGYVRTRIRVITLFEDGLLLRSNKALSIGSTLDLESNLFADLGMHAPGIRVISCTASGAEGSWDIEAQFVGLKEATLQRIRAFIISQSTHTLRMTKDAA